HAVAVAADAANGEVFDGDVFAIGWMNRPHLFLCRGEAFKMHVCATYRLNNTWPARHLASTQDRIAGYLAGTDYSDVAGFVCRDKGAMRIHPAAFPAGFDNWVIIEIGAAA